MVFRLSKGPIFDHLWGTIEDHEDSIWNFFDSICSFCCGCCLQHWRCFSKYNIFKNTFFCIFYNFSLYLRLVFHLPNWTTSWGIWIIWVQIITGKCLVEIKFKHEKKNLSFFRIDFNYIFDILLTITFRASDYEPKSYEYDYQQAVDLPPQVVAQRADGTSGI